MDTCDCKPCTCFRQVAKNNQLEKNPHGKYNHNGNCILFMIVGIFHPLTHCSTMWLHIRLHKYWATFKKKTKFEWFNIIF
jgi:hypothetical protein